MSVRQAEQDAAYGMGRAQLKKNCKQAEVATLGGGCFWCLEAVFSEVKGVTTVEPGYSGGNWKNPTYDQVSSGATGHAEVVQLTFDPETISFRTILDIFFATHNPTTLNRQGADVGTQYRSVIFYHNTQQRATAERLVEELQDAKAYAAPLVTEILPFEAVYKAEAHHKDYFKRHPEQPYCELTIAPKIAKLRTHYPDKLKASPG